MVKHAKFSASGAERWVTCPASIQESEKYPTPPSSKYADEGTKAHELCEAFLLKGPEGVDVDPYSAEMLTHARTYFDHVRDVQDALGGFLFVEKRVEAASIGPDCFGTCDAVVYEPFGRLHIIDFKYGKGVSVEVEKNLQLAYYAIGFADSVDWDFHEVTMTIVQPRAEHQAGPIRSWTISRRELLDMVKVYRKARAEALIEKPPFGPSEKACRWCPAKGGCPALRKNALATAGAVFDDGKVKLPDPKTYGPEQFKKFYEGLPILETWIKAVKDEAMAIFRRGESIPGYKVVEGRTHRKWADGAEEEIRQRVDNSDELFVTKLTTPAQAEKILKKQKGSIADLIVKPQGKPTIVTDSDRRPALALSAIGIFGEIEDE